MSLLALLSRDSYFPDPFVHFVYSGSGPHCHLTTPQNDANRSLIPASAGNNTPPGLSAGSVGSLANDDVDGGLAVLGEVFEAFDRPEAEVPEQRQHCVAQGGERWCALILAGIVRRLAGFSSAPLGRLKALPQRPDQGVLLSVRPATMRAVSVTYLTMACASEAEGCGNISASASEVKVDVLNKALKLSTLLPDGHSWRSPCASGRQCRSFPGPKACKHLKMLSLFWDGH